MKKQANKRQMTPEKALRWLLEFGSDWVDCGDLNGTWADEGIYWHDAEKRGYLETRDEVTYDIRLTPKALELIQNLGETK